MLHGSLYNKSTARENLSNMQMQISIGRIVVLVRDYAEARDFYIHNFDCKILFDQTNDDGKRYLHIGFSKDNAEAGIWFLKAEQDQLDKVGRQTGGPIMVLYTDDLDQVCKKLKNNNVTITMEPVDLPAYSFLHFLDFVRH
jgi:predicted enzyme related to lactoylglutathione lyase